MENWLFKLNFKLLDPVESWRALGGGQRKIRLGCGAVMCSAGQSCPALCDPVDCSPPGSSVHGILQARILEWVALPSSRGSSQPRDQKPRSPALRGDSFLSEPPEKPVEAYSITWGSAVTRFAEGSVPTSMRFSWASAGKSQLKKAGGRGNFLEGEVGEWFAYIIFWAALGVSLTWRATWFYVL